MEKNLAIAITYLYPHLQPFVDFRVVSEAGKQWVTDWKAIETEPSDAELEIAWNSYITSINPLDELKQQKIDLLKTSCNNAIIGKFITQVDGITYSFSNDSEAQSNFKDAKDAWTYGYMPNTQTVRWTAYDSNGNVVRLDLTEEQFDPINIARMTWQQTNVAKLRDILEPQVNVATSQVDLDKIVW